jgi:hypothetical protein
MGPKCLEYNPGSELNLFSLTNEQKAKESSKNKSRTKDVWQSRTTNKITEQQ